MGQYFKVVNLDKKQYLHPHRLGDKLNLALALLLADYHTISDPIAGSWLGDEVVCMTDVEPVEYEDVSARVAGVLKAVLA